jgi:hypothetical protein
MVAAKLANLGKGRHESNTSIDAFVSQPAAAAMLNTNLAPGYHSRMIHR